MLLINFIKKAFRDTVKKQSNLTLFCFTTPKLKSNYLFFVLLCVSFISRSQNLDSLYQVAKNTKDDSTKIRLYNKIGFSYIFNDPEKAAQIIKEGQQLAHEAKFNFGLTELTNTYGIYLDVTGKSDSARYYFENALDLSRKYKISSIESMCLNNLGMYNWNRGNYKKAQEYFFQSLKKYEDEGDRESTSIALNNIGLIYQEMNLNEQALEYHYKSYEIRKEFNLKKDQVASLNNIGICLKDLGRFDEAIKTYEKGMAIAQSTNNLLDYYRIIENLGSLYDEQGEYKKAASYYNIVYNKTSDFKDDKGKLITTGKLIGIYNKLNISKTAVSYIKEAEIILTQFPHYATYAEDLYINAAESYYRIGEPLKAREYIQKFVKLKNDSFSDENAKAIADLEIKYDTEKKEKQILVQRAELAEKELNIQKKNYLIFLSIGFALLLGLSGYFLFNQQKIKNRQLQKDNELKQAILRIENQNRLHEQRLKISRDLHDNIGAQLTFIISSLDNLKYGFEIPNNLNDKIQTISQFTSDTITDLRDTIWAMNKSEISVEDLESRISNYINKAKLADNNINFSFVGIQDTKESPNFSTVQGMNIYRIIQEAVNNALKYANAENITISFNQIQDKYKISIKDDGIGFDVINTEQGNGLNNMRKRAEELNASLSIYSEKNQGTEILFTL